MQIETHLNFKKYKRFFAVGCSFTNYCWSTWADMIGYHVDEYYNVGYPGAGNQYIASMISEIDQKYNLNENDLVICMWSSINREDRYKNNSWHLGGNVYSSKTLESSFVKKWADERFYLIRDLAQINLTKNLLENKNVDWDFLSMIDIGTIEGLDNQGIRFDDIKYNYEDLIEKIKPSVFSSVLGSNWNFCNKKENDNHPTPEYYLKYLKFLYPENFQDNQLEQLVLTENIQVLMNNFEYDFTNLNKNKKVSNRKKFVHL